LFAKVASGVWSCLERVRARERRTEKGVVVGTARDNSSHAMFQLNSKLPWHNIKFIKVEKESFIHAVTIVIYATAGRFHDACRTPVVHLARAAVYKCEGYLSIRWAPVLT
jgi:hypothetical protein